VQQAAPFDPVQSFIDELGIVPEEDTYFGWLAEYGLQGDVLPPEWSMHEDASTGRYYYSDGISGSSSWENPLADCLQGIVEIGRQYLRAPSDEFFQDQKDALWGKHEQNLSEWHGPFSDESGRTYFSNSVTGESSWRDPRQDTQFMYELEGTLLDALQDTLPLPGPDEAPVFGSTYQPPARTPRALTPRQLPSSPQSPQSPGSPGKTWMDTVASASVSQHEQQNTYEKMLKAADQLDYWRKDAEEAQLLLMARKVRERRKRVERQKKEREQARMDEEARSRGFANAEEERLFLLQQKSQAEQEAIRKREEAEAEAARQKLLAEEEEERRLQEVERRRLAEEEEKKRVAEEKAAKKEAERREAERKREEELRPFGPSDRVREMLEKRETKLKLEPAAPDKVVPASPRTKPKEMVVDQDISLEKEFQSGKRGSSVSSSREQLRATTANFQKVLNEVASAPAGSEALAFWSRRARVDTTFFHQVLDEIAPAGRDEESHIGAAASSGLQRSNSWHARQCRSADSSEPPTSPSILLKARSGLMRTKTFEREPEQTTSKQMVTPEKGVERGQSKDMQSTWEEDVAARGKLLRVSTARFNSLLDQVIQAPPGSKELQAAAEKARMEADEFHHILDQVAPAADADAQQAITVGPTSPRSPQRKRSWPPASDPASPSKSSQQRRQQLVQHLRTR